MTFSEKVDAERKERRAFILGRGEAIAKRLNGDWQVEVPEDQDHKFVELVLDDKRLCVSYDEWKDRLWISGTLPLKGEEPGAARYFFHESERKRHNIGKLEISVAAKKAPVAIARDIFRRLMPDYEKAIKVAREEIERENEHAQRYDKLKEAVAQAVGAEPAGQRSKFGSLYGGGLEADVQSSNSVHVTVRLEGSAEEIKTAIQAIQKAVARRAYAA